MGGGQKRKNKKGVTTSTGRPFDPSAIKGKPGSGKAGRCGNFVDLSSADQNKTAADRMQIYMGAKKWYDYFVAHITEDDVKKLKATANGSKVSWDVAATVAQLDMLYSRIKEYKNEAEKEIAVLQQSGAFLQLDNTKLVNGDGVDVSEADYGYLNDTFKENKLSLGVIPLKSTIQKASRPILAAAIAFGRQTGERPEKALGLAYDRFNDSFYVFFNSNYGPDGARIAIRFVIRDSGTVKDITGFDAYTVPTQVHHIAGEDALKDVFASGRTRSKLTAVGVL